MQDDYVSTEHMLLGLAESSESKRLVQFGLTKEAILAALKQVRGAQRVTTQNPEGTFQSLEKYGRDLTAMTRQGKLDPVIGRLFPSASNWPQVELNLMSDTKIGYRLASSCN
jgi:ATP-dependent Clp protease ATP-binding subunit ClpB